MRRQDNPEYLDESSTQHFVWELYIQVSHQEHFFLQHMHAFFTSSKFIVKVTDTDSSTINNIKKKPLKLWLPFKSQLD